MLESSCFLLEGAVVALAGGVADTLEDLLEADRQARRVAGAYLEALRA